MMLEPIPFCDEMLKEFLREDIGGGDLTTLAVFSASERKSIVRAGLYAEKKGILCGSLFAERLLRILDPSSSAKWNHGEGEAYSEGDTIGILESRLSDLLAAERLILNLVKHLSGIASLTRAYVDRVNECRPSGMRPLRITETRKTLPGLRAFQKYAVRIGGGHNHRYDLHGGILIKDNHLAVSRSVRTTLETARRNAPHPLRIEIEADTPEQAMEACLFGADVILLDNMPFPVLERLVGQLRLNRQEILLEVSGGVSLERVPQLATLDVDILSVGALTHSSPDAPIRLDFLD
jgi:nicotinate-nucleotide pyrophosphorylase (carboxylating)